MNRQREEERNRGYQSYQREQDRDFRLNISRDQRSLPQVTPSSAGSQRSISHRSNNPERHRSTNRDGDSWDIQTPLPTRPPEDLDVVFRNRNRPVPKTGDDSDDEDFDRQFYLAEEEGGFVLDPSEIASNGDMGRFLFVNEKTKAREVEMEKRREQGGGRFNARKSQLQGDEAAWIENRLLNSGAAIQGEVSLDMTTEDDSRVTLLVHQVKPPFLDGRVSFSTIREAVPIVKDASSDFAKMSREGSETLRRLRETKDKHAMRQKFWELGGTRMGDAVGIKGAERKEGDGEQEIDYKKSAGFAAHMKKKKDGDAPVSEFARQKSMRQQREYLPIFSVRDELLNVIRENNVVVIVGETVRRRKCRQMI
jgi:pre-mRNA-splicing factor ATP-dependent RNA helicase DHX38/PRP16